MVAIRFILTWKLIFSNNTNGNYLTCAWFKLCKILAPASQSSPAIDILVDLCQNIRHNMVEKGSTNSGRGLLPPTFRALPERRHFSYRRCSLMMMIIFTITCASITHSEAVRCPPPLSPMMATFKEREIILENYCHYLTLDESTPRVPALST